jgi:TonB family protein
MTPARIVAPVTLALALLGAALLPAEEPPLVAGSEGVPIPKKTKFVQPVYPPEARAQGIRGIVILELVIDTQGHVAQASVLRSVPGLDEAAVVAARQWEYEPVKVGGKPVSLRLTVPITFALKLPEVSRQEGIPELRQGVTPSWPASASGGGRANAEVTLEPDGRIGVARIVAGEPPWSDALLQALKTWRFATPPEDATLSFRVEAEFVARGKDAPRVDLRLTGLQTSASFGSPETGVPASRVAAPPTPVSAPAGAPASPSAAAPGTAPAVPVAQGTPARPTPSTTGAPAPTTPETGAQPAPPAVQAPRNQPPTPATPSNEPKTAEAPARPVAAPAGPAAPASASPALQRPSAPAPPSPPTGGAPPSTQAPTPGGTSPAAPPPVEVITAPPPPPPPENGVSAIRDVTLEAGVPDLTRGRHPVVPPLARLGGASGTVEVAFSVSAAGATAVRSVDGPDLLKPAAEATVGSWVFRRTRADRAYLVAVFTYAGDKASAAVRPQPQPPQP